jgi:DnaK suppressor protein
LRTRKEFYVANTEIDEGFVAGQRERLLQMRDELQRIQSGMQGDEQNRSEEEGDFSQHDSGDMSQQMFTREMDATIGEQAGRRLEDVERALAKIEEGTYGLSDESGQPIARGRLEAAPEALRTVEEQQDYERERRPPV